MPRVLVVDDDPEVVSLIGKLLQAAGHTAVPASDSRAALRILDETPIDLVIADIFMPDMDGLETVAAFKRQAPHLPLIALSGFAFAERGAGAPDFLAMATKLGAACSLRK
ncbi:MAG: response regulator, partial [Rhizobiales bacterium]|nr:response regulator [Hyphomicrobiales bacterium]